MKLINYFEIRIFEICLTTLVRDIDISILMLLLWSEGPLKYSFATYENY